MQQRPYTALFAILAVVALCPAIALSDGSGRTGRTLKSSSSGCGSCHGSSAASGVTVTIAGPDTLIRNQPATFTLTISGGPGTDAGCDISARFGTVGPVSSTLKLSGSEVTQKNPLSMTTGSVTVQFSYTPTGAGASDTLYATGISTNGSGSSGDQWNWAPKKIVAVLSPTAVGDEPLIAHAHALYQNYPNPFNPATTIRFDVPSESFVSLKVYNVLGEEVADLVHQVTTPGANTVSFDASALPSGVYIYRIAAGEFVDVRRMLLLR